MAAFMQFGHYWVRTGGTQVPPKYPPSTPTQVGGAPVSTPGLEYPGTWVPLLEYLKTSMHCAKVNPGGEKLNLRCQFQHGDVRAGRWELGQLRQAGYSNALPLRPMPQNVVDQPNLAGHLNKLSDV